MSLRTRLLGVALLPLAIGVGALLVIGNVLLRTGVHDQAQSVLRARAEAQLAALNVTPTSVGVRNAPNEQSLDERSCVLDGDRVAEHPRGVSPNLDRAAIALGRQRRTASLDGPGDIRLHTVPVPVPGSQRAVGSVVVGYSMEQLEDVQH